MEGQGGEAEQEERVRMEGDGDDDDNGSRAGVRGSEESAQREGKRESLRLDTRYKTMGVPRDTGNDDDDDCGVEEEEVEVEVEEVGEGDDDDGPPSILMSMPLLGLFTIDSAEA